MYRALAFTLGSLAALLAAGLFWLLGTLGWPLLQRGQVAALRPGEYAPLGLALFSALLLAALASVLLFPRAGRRGRSSGSSIGRLVLWVIFAAAVVAGIVQA
jgi:hypothetical protein